MEVTMTLPQLSPASLIANPGNINPLAHANNNTAAAVAGTVAQQNTRRSKTDSVTISREALAKASETENGKGTQTKEAAHKAKEK
jgi:hypothetical protein